MHLKTLKVFCDVVGKKSFSRAASENGISQSRASQAVHQLEEHLGVQLIDRSKRPFVLTAAGSLFYDGSRQLLQRYDALQEQVQLLWQDVGGRVTVASIYSIGLYYMDDFVKRHQEQAPQTHVHLEYQTPAGVYDLVESDQADFGLVSYPKKSRTISMTPWWDEPMLLVCSPEHTLAGASSIDLNELAGQRMIGFSHDLQIRRELDRLLHTARVQVDVAMEFDNIETLKRALEIHAGCSILPEPTVRREVESGSLIAIPIRDKHLVRPVGIIRRRGRILGSAAQHCLEHLLSATSSGAGETVKRPELVTVEI